MILGQNRMGIMGAVLSKTQGKKKNVYLYIYRLPKLRRGGDETGGNGGGEAKTTSQNPCDR